MNIKSKRVASYIAKYGIEQYRLHQKNAARASVIARLKKKFATP